MKKQVISKEEAIDIIVEELYNLDIEELLDILKDYCNIDDYEIREND